MYLDPNPNAYEYSYTVKYNLTLYTIKLPLLFCFYIDLNNLTLTLLS